MIVLTYTLWFVITLLDGNHFHVPVDNVYLTEADCEADRPEWQALIESQWPDDPDLRTYCEAFPKDLPTKEL